MKFDYDFLRNKLYNATFEQAKKITVSHEDMSKVFRGKRYLEASEIMNLAEALDIKPSEFNRCFFNLVG